MRFALLDAQSAGVEKKNARVGPTVLGTGLSVVALKRSVDAGGSTLAGQVRKFVWVGSLSQLDARPRPPAGTREHT